MRTKTTRLILLFCTYLVTTTLASCVSTEETHPKSGVTNKPPTSTSIPTSTIAPTETIQPTITFTPKPTLTAAPTELVKPELPYLPYDYVGDITTAIGKGYPRNKNQNLYLSFEMDNDKIGISLSRFLQSGKNYDGVPDIFGYKGGLFYYNDASLSVTALAEPFEIWITKDWVEAITKQGKVIILQFDLDSPDRPKEYIEEQGFEIGLVNLLIGEIPDGEGWDLKPIYFTQDANGNSTPLPPSEQPYQGPTRPGYSEMYKIEYNLYKKLPNPWVLNSKALRAVGIFDAADPQLNTLKKIVDATNICTEARYFCPSHIGWYLRIIPSDFE
jgi:hypothetical protein